MFRQTFRPIVGNIAVAEEAGVPKGMLSALLFALLLAVPMLQAEAQVRTLDLREMVHSSGAIFIGRVIQVHGGVDRYGDVVTYTTFLVEEPIHNVDLGTAFTIKQFGGETQELATYVTHMRYFRYGERVLVMLYPESELGFTSPIGLDQGTWRVSDEGMVQGVTAATLRGVEDLFREQGVEPTPGTIPRTAFVDVIKEVINEPIMEE